MESWTFHYPLGKKLGVSYDGRRIFEAENVSMKKFMVNGAVEGAGVVTFCHCNLTFHMGYDSTESSDIWNGLQKGPLDLQEP